MKKLITIFAGIVVFCNAYAQPILKSDSVTAGAGRSFNVYSLGNVDINTLRISGANVTWDFSSATRTLGGTATLVTTTPYASQYPISNFAIGFTMGNTTFYSMFNLTSSVMEEVANGVGTGSGDVFTNYRTALAFPFTFGLSNTDTYQKSGQGTKTVINTYDSYGTFITGKATYHNVIRILTVDDGDTSVAFWTTSPSAPLFTGNSNGITLFQDTTSATGIAQVNSEGSINFYPNPATNELTIINKEPGELFEVYNLMGQMQFSTNQSTIDISAINQGIYFIKARSAKGMTIQKFVKN